MDLTNMICHAVAFVFCTIGDNFSLTLLKNNQP